jgi:membrane-associated protease RseP (regulator of RpoE activity)
MLVLAHSVTAQVKEWPSLFRGVVVAEAPFGVRVVSVEASSQAAQADLRPEDLIMRVDETPITSLEEFAGTSRRLKGRTASAQVLVVRNGAPRTIRLHLYSYPLLRAWGIEAVPNTDLRFAQPQIAQAYWIRQGRGFAIAGKLAEARDVYLNALHHVPEDAAVALTVVSLDAQLAEQALRARAVAQAAGSLAEALGILQHVFERPLTDDQLRTIQEEMADILKALRSTSPQQSSDQAIE